MWERLRSRPPPQELRFGQRKGRYCSTESQGGPSVGSAWGQAEHHLETETRVWEAAKDTPGQKPQHRKEGLGVERVQGTESRLGPGWGPDQPAPCPSTPPSLQALHKL